MKIEYRIKKFLVRLIRFFRRYKFTALIFLPFGLLIIFYFLIPLLITHGSWGLEYGAETGWIGDTIGGIVGPMVGFIGVILTFMAFYAQYRANQIQLSVINEQRESSKKDDRRILVQQIENNFFELLKLHRENVREIYYRGSNGRNVFVIINNEFRDSLIEVRKWNDDSRQNLEPLSLVNIAYHILFFGVSEDSEEILTHRLTKAYDLFLATKIIENLIKPLRKRKYSKIKFEGRTKISYDQRLFYNGHQSRLGHYFRHLLRTVNFIHNDPHLTEDEKRKYITILRTQLSTHEQIVFFFNSLSDLGKPWELDEAVEPKNKLITIYELIRNIPIGGTYEIDPIMYYPKIKYEHPFRVTIVG